MSLSRILNTLIPHKARDFVGVFTSDLKQIFPRARAIKASVKPESKPMEHPLESGALTTDHRIILPIEIELAMVLQAEDYADTYREITSYYRQGTLLTVQTKAGIYTNQFIVSLPHEESPEFYDALTLVLKLKQVLIVSPKYGVTPKRAKNSNTVNRGTQESKPTTIAADGGAKYFGITQPAPGAITALMKAP